ncbi:MAG: hypothetical protein ACRDNY_12870 [Gaiellaceae bacterium]
MLTALVLLAGVGLVPPAALADRATVVNGGGTGTFGADLDADGDVDGSHFGLGITIRADGSVRGHFECLMAGNADILGLPLMAVEGNVTAASVSESTALVSGVATVNLGSSGRFRDVPFSVVLTPGGPGAGTLELTVVGAFDGVPGDTVPGNGDYDLPTETVSAGHISIR